MRIGLMAVVVAALVALTATGTGSATTPPTVSLLTCWALGGTATVPAGVPVTVGVGYGQQSRGRIQNFINSQTTTASLDGVAVPGATGLWSAPEAVGDAYATFWRVSAGVLAQPGDTATVTLQTNLSHRIPGAKDPDTGKPSFDGPGDLFPENFTCTVTAV